MRDYLEQIKADPALRVAVETARAWGVSPGRFLGREPAVTVTPTQDGGFRVARAPEWDDEARGLALALAAYEAELCPGCRQPLAETTAPENEGRYVAAAPVLCHRCAASSMAGEAYQDHPHASALLLQVELRDPVVVPVE